MNQSQLSSNRMGEAPLLPLILSLSGPVMFSLLIQSLYSIVDSFYVARYSAHALTAVTLAFPLQTLIIALSTGISVGVGSLISRRLGAGDHPGACEVASHGLLLALLGWAAFVALGLPVITPYFHAFTPTPEIWELGGIYTRIVFVFSLGVFVESTCVKTLQAQGNMVQPMLIQAGAAVVNIVLDPIFIFGLGGVPAMGIAGAAAATVLAQLASAACCLFIMLRPGREVSVTLRGFRLRRAVVKEIFVVGMPSMLMQALYTFYMAGLNAILSGFSDSAVTVLGIYYKLQTFLFMPTLGLNQGTLPIFSYNFGAGQFKRLWQTLRYSCLLSLASYVVSTALFLLIPAQLLGIFSPDGSLLEIGVPALRIISLNFVFCPFTILIPTMFQATGFGRKSILLTLLRQLILLVPLAYLFSRFGLVYLWFTYPVSEIITAAFACYYAYRLRKGMLRY